MHPEVIVVSSARKSASLISTCTT